MRKNVYLQLIDIADTYTIRRDQIFSQAVIKKLVTEYGALFTADATYHILVGRFPTEGCHWCGCETEIRKPETFFTIPQRYQQIFMQCTNCGSRGPVLNVVERIIENKEAIEEQERFVRERYKQINPFRGFVNPYNEEK